MARHGENIRKRKDGRWEGRYQVYSEEKEKTVYRSIYGYTYEEVRENLTVQKNLLRGVPKNGGYQDKSYSLRFSEVAKEWLAEIERHKKPSTYVKYSVIYRTHIEYNFQQVMISDITDTFVMEKVSDHLSDSVYKSIYCVLNQILEFASKRYAFAFIRLKGLCMETKKRPVKVLARSEQKKLMTVLHQEMDIFKMAVLLCLCTGLRLGEVCALKWCDVDFENKILMINRTVQRLPVEDAKTKTVLMETVPKSEYSKREIPFSDTISEILIKFWNDKAYVFGGDKPLEPRTLQYHFKKILEEAGLEDKNFHILRHTFSTNCIEGGTDIKSLSEILGHADVKITLQRYVHPSMANKRKCINELSRFYGQICGQAG